MKQWAEDSAGPFRWKGNEGQARCKLPGHNGQDQNPSFAFNAEKGTGHCFACHAAGQGLSVKELATAWGVEPPPMKSIEQAPPARRLVAAYDYMDATGNIVYQSCRFEPKGFSQRRPDGKGGWIWNLQGVKPIPYRLPELLLALEQDKPVFVVEGEKDVDRLRGLGLVATTNSGGAGKWTDEHSKYFPSWAKIIILPDYDEPGRNHARTVASSLHGRGCAVKIVELPGLPPKGDVSDWLDARQTKAELYTLIQAATEWMPETAPPVVAEKAEDEWPDPELLQESVLPPVASIEEEMLPEAFRPWLVDITHRMQGVLDFVAVGAIVCASSVIGAGCSIRPKRKDDWEIVPNLWGGVVGRPSVVMKSPSLAEVMKPIVRLEVQAKENFEDEQLWAEAGKLDFKAQQEALKQELLAVAKGKSKRNRTRDEIKAEFAALGTEPAAIRRRFRVNDATIEKLQELMNESPRGLLYFRDELTGLLASWNREDRQQDRAFFLECWEGKQPFTIDRIGRGTTDTKNACLSLLGGIQPSKLAAYLLQSVGNLTNDGMVQRFQLMVYPDEPAAWKLIDEAPDLQSKQRAFEIFKALAEMDFLQAGAIEGKDRPFFRFDDAAQELFYRWYTELEGKIRSDENPLLCEHFGKYRSLMPSLALVLHLVEVAGGAEAGPVTKKAAAMAADWVDYLETHARRIYSMVADIGPMAAAALVEKIKKGKVKDGFTAREVYKNHWQNLDDPELVAGACDELEAAGWVRRETIASTGGRPKVTFRINPKIFR